MYLQQNLLMKGQVFYMYSSRRLVQLGSPHQCYIQQVLVLGSENLGLCNNIRCEYLLSVWLWNLFNGGPKLVWPKINKLYIDPPLRKFHNQSETELVSLYCKRRTFGGSSYAKKANKNEQDHANWMVDTQLGYY